MGTRRIWGGHMGVELDDWVCFARVDIFAVVLQQRTEGRVVECLSRKSRRQTFLFDPFNWSRTCKIYVYQP